MKPKRRRPLAVPDVPDPMQRLEIPADATRGQEAKIVLDAASKAIRDARAQEKAMMDLTQDADCVLVFDSREQKKAFLTGMRKKYALRFPGDIYLDGHLLADALAIEIPEVKTKMPGPFRIDKKLAAIAQPIPKKKHAR